MGKINLIKGYCGGNGYPVDESTSLQEIQRTIPLFFRTPHGKRETIDVYRGFLIVRNTVKFTGCKPERWTAVYLFTSDLEGQPGTLCVTTPVENTVINIAQARRLIDRIIKNGTYLPRKES
jgi:hypothetical protein